MRKAKGLIAILANSPNQTLDRASLQDALWPDSTASMQQTSLRQALAHIRKALSAEFIVSTREVCRIGSGIHLSRDLDEPAETRAEQDEATFLPEFPEPWFERHRRKLRMERGEAMGESPSGGTTLIEGLMTLLRWYSNTDPAKTLALLRDHIEIAEGVSPKELFPLVSSGLAATKKSDVLFGWGLLWKGNCLMVTQNIAAGEPFLKRAIEYGIEHEDNDLQVRATCSIASGYAMTGKIAAASNALLRVESLVGPGSPNQAAYNSSRGAVLHHGGRGAEGLRFVHRALESNGISETERNRFQALLAVFLSTNMKSREALDLLEAPEKFGRETGNILISLLVQLAKGQVYLNENCPEVAVQILADLARRASNCQSSQLELYARESSALALWRIGDAESARREIRAAQRVRSALGLGFTPWDSGRLGELGQRND